MESVCGAVGATDEWGAPQRSPQRRVELDSEVPVFQTREVNRTQLNVEIISAAHMNGKDRGRLPSFAVPMRL